MLEDFIRNHLGSKQILIMAHLVLGYPSFTENRKIIEVMAKSGIELIELQIPFSEPTADGPVILKANSCSIVNGTKVNECFAFAEEVSRAFPEVSFLFMTYYNIVFVRGESLFIENAKKAGIKGFILPDLPPEEAESWLNACKEERMNSIFIFTPTHSETRLKELSAVANGFVYCIGRRGVTGKKTEFDASLTRQIIRYKQATNLPIALGFGIQEKSDIDFLQGKVDIAVIGSQLITLHEKLGVEGVEEFLMELR